MAKTEKVWLRYPDRLYRLVQEAIAQDDSVDDALKRVEKQWRSDKEFGRFVDEMVKDALRHLIQDARHRRISDVKKEAGEYGRPAKIGIATGATSECAMRCILDEMSIQGRLLGDITGGQLLELARKERKFAAGRLVNARLCELLAPLVPNGKAVRNVVTNEQAMGLLAQAQKTKGKAA